MNYIGHRQTQDMYFWWTDKLYYFFPVVASFDQNDVKGARNSLDVVEEQYLAMEGG
jgi:hypothetical protein